MLVDQDGHQIFLATKPNANLNISGMSGYGKTFYINQKVGEYCRKGKNVMIIDTSYSYIPEELEKSACPFQDCVKWQDPSDDIVMFSLDTPQSLDAAKKLVSIMALSFNIRSYQQKAILREVCTDLFESEGIFCFSLLVEMLEHYRGNKRKEGDYDTAKQVALLLNRFEVVSDLDTIMVAMEPDNLSDNTAQVAVLQLSSFAPDQQHYLSAFCIELFWSNVQTAKHKGAQQPYQVYVIDEFQNIAKAMRIGCAVYRFLREGRKFGVAVLLCSQFMSDLGEDTQAALMQCGNTLFFHPDDKHMKSTAKLLSQQSAEWEGVLRTLQIGQAVLKGCYYVDGCHHEITDIIKVKVITKK